MRRPSCGVADDDTEGEPGEWKKKKMQDPKMPRKGQW